MHERITYCLEHGWEEFNAHILENVTVNGNMFVCKETCFINSLFYRQDLGSIIIYLTLIE